MRADKNIKILVIDDEKTIRDFLVRLLSTDAGLVEAVANASQAREAVKSQRFDFVFLDLQMASGDSIELLAALKEISPSSKYVLMVNDLCRDLLSKVAEKSYSAWVRKPFDIIEVMRVIRSPLPPCSRQRLAVLVIDDDQQVREFFKKLLQEGEYEVTCLDSLTSALSLQNTMNFDLIFLAAKLCGAGRHALCEKIKEASPMAEIMVMAGRNEEKHIAKIKPTPLLLGKPFEIDKILAALQRVKKLKGIC